MVNKCVESVRRFLYPDLCLLCGANTGDDPGLCHGCRQELPLNHHCCPRCALPLPASGDTAVPCGECQQQPPPFDRCISPFLYHPPIDWLINGLKFHARLCNARLLAALLSRSVAEKGVGRPDLLIPVPLHPGRLRRRGYNQALELARHLGRQLSIPLNHGSCIRQRPTAPQAGADRAQRQRNLRRAFALRNRPQAEHVALIDDVVTTGATVSELAETLRRAGILRVDVWAVARTPRTG